MENTFFTVLHLNRDYNGRFFETVFVKLCAVCLDECIASDVCNTFKKTCGGIGEKGNLCVTVEINNFLIISAYFIFTCFVRNADIINVIKIAGINL